MTELAAAVELPETTLYMESLNAGVATRPPVVLLHGWGCSRSIWGDFPRVLAEQLPGREILLLDLPGFGDSEPLPECSEQTVLEALAATLPERVVLLGWSLGGMLATAFAAKWPQRVEAVIAMGANASYCQRSNWPQALPPGNLSGFAQQLAEEPQQCLKRFRANQVRNDERERELLRQLSRLSDKNYNAAWDEMLQLLDSMDNREALRNLSVEALYLFGEQDLMVPAAAAQSIADLNSAIHTQVLPGVSHVLHLSQAEQISQAVADFLGQLRALDKRLVRQSFGRSAASYDSVAYLQREVGEQLFEQLEPGLPNLNDKDWVLDLGCGTGHFLAPLQENISKANVLALDLAEGMLQYARQKQPENTAADGIDWLCGDAEQLPLASNSVALIFSNLAVQWCEDVDLLVAELYRVLKPGGTAFLSTLASETLTEMRAAWQQVDEQVHVNGFKTVAELQAAFSAAPFADCQLQVATQHTHYPDVFALSRELKALGAHNVNAGRRRGMTGRKRVQQFAAAYEPFRCQQSQQLPATWQVVHIQLSKPLKETVDEQ